MLDMPRNSDGFNDEAPDSQSPRLWVPEKSHFRYVFPRITNRGANYPKSRFCQRKPLMSTLIKEQTLSILALPRWAPHPLYTHSRSKTRTFGLRPLGG
jgi:hypothetical protein